MKTVFCDKLFYFSFGLRFGHEYFTRDVVPLPFHPDLALSKFLMPLGEFSFGSVLFSNRCNLTL
jgi:hypothetical protein